MVICSLAVLLVLKTAVPLKNANLVARQTMKCLLKGQSLTFELLTRACWVSSKKCLDNHAISCLLKLGSVEVEAKLKNVLKYQYFLQVVFI